MSFDMAAPLAGYRTFFGSYKEAIKTRLDYLALDFNFGITSDQDTYYDFWYPMIDSANLKNISFDSLFDSLTTSNQSISNSIGSRYLDYVGMVQSMDQYLCYAVDSFSRIADSYYSFGDGSMYETRTGKQYEDGSYEILRKSLRTYLEEISLILTDMENYIFTEPGMDALPSVYGMAKTKAKDVDYLTWKRDNYFVPKVIEISNILDEVHNELTKLIGYSGIVNTAITTWLPETFKLISYTSLAFNLNKKTEHLANRIMNVTGGVTTTSIIAVNQAKFWRQQVKPDYTNRGECLTQAILAGCDALVYPGQLSTLIDISWEYMVPKYGR